MKTKEIGSTTLNITAIDSAGNKSEGKLKVDVKDISAPNISLSKSSVTVTKGKSFNAKKYLRSAIDNKDGNMTCLLYTSRCV